MTTGQLIVLDLAVSVVVAAGWLAAAGTVASGRARVGAALLVAAVAATLARGGSVLALGGTGGWWFVSEKVLLALPLLGVAAAAAVALAGPRLLAAARGRPGAAPAARAPAAVVPLFTAGFAAAAGPAVTLLAGYPPTWSTGLLAWAGVGAAGLVTWRAVAPERADAAARRPGVAAVAGVAVLGGGLAFLPGDTVDAGGGPPPATAAGPARSVADLRGPDTPAPGGEVRRYALTARTATVTLGSGRQIDAWTYNGEVPGPPITARQGDLIEVTLRNADIAEGVTLHWHGYEVPAGEDGAPGATQDVVAPGEEFRYRFRAEAVGTYWYHTHSASHPAVRRGLYGTLVVRPREPDPAEPDPAAPGAAELDLTVPVHTFDGVRVFGADDQPRRHQAAPGTAVRLRLINTDSTPHRFALTGTGYRVVAVDGRDLSGPEEVGGVRLRLAAGGRYDLAFTMPAGPVALVAAAEPDGGLRLAPGPGDPAEVPDPSGWPELDLLDYGTPAGTPFHAGTPVDRDFTLVLDRGLAMVEGMPRYAQTVNGKGFPNVPEELVAEGDLVRIRVVNRSLEVHPWHLHGHVVLVLSRDGRASTGSPLWLDTFEVRPGEVWEVVFRANNPGLWMNHCHNLPHAEAGMMLHLRYDGVSSPYHH